MSAANANGVEGPDHRGEMTMHSGVSGQDGNTNNVFAGHGDPANGGTAASTSSGLKFVNNFDGAMVSVTVLSKSTPFVAFRMYTFLHAILPHSTSSTCF